MTERKAELDAENAGANDKREAKNFFETKLFGFRRLGENEKLSPEDQAEVKKVYADGETWLNANQDAEGQVYKDKVAEYQKITDPIEAKSKVEIPQ